jgi:hypothetical protein
MGRGHRDYDRCLPIVRTRDSRPPSFVKYLAPLNCSQASDSFKLLTRLKRCAAAVFPASSSVDYSWNITVSWHRSPLVSDRPSAASGEPDEIPAGSKAGVS